jgi:ribonucleoside-diphosphate reductase alpha chain
LKDLLRKVKLAAILGTMQATLTDFRYLRSGWKKNAEEEALLGVSLTGIMDNELTSGKKGKRELAEVLDEMRLCVVSTNKEWAKVLGINQAAAATCTKPSGTVSQLVDCASGIHPRFSQYYIRRVRADKKDPLARMMIDQGFPVEDDVMKPDNQFVFSFPMKSPDGCVVATQMSAIEQLELWKIYQTHWAEHKISMTVYVGEDEWMDVGAWVYRHFNIMSGVAFLPRQGHMYKQTPYEEITKEEYEKMENNSAVKVDWSQLGKYETEDTFVAHKELTCTGLSCELVDVIDRK